MSGTIYPAGSSFPPYFFSAQGDIFGAGCSFQYGTVFAEGNVFMANCRFLGDACNYCQPYIIFGIGNVMGPNCMFYYCIFAFANVAGNVYIDLGSNIPAIQNVLGGPPMFTTSKGHHEFTGSHTPSKPGCDQVETTGNLDKDPFCPTKEYSTWVGSTGGGGIGGGCPDNSTRTP